MTLQRSTILGAWTLQSYVVVDGTGRTIAAPLGDDAVGHLLYTADGYMSAQLMRHLRPESDTDADHYLAYSGPFDIDEVTTTLYHRVDVSLRPDWVGGQQVRLGSMHDGLLILSGDVAEEFGAGALAVLTWHRPDRRAQ